MGQRGWKREIVTSWATPRDHSEGAVLVLRAYDGLWYVAQPHPNCRRIAGPYRHASSARRRAEALVADYTAEMLEHHPAIREMGRAEDAARRRAGPRPHWH